MNNKILAFAAISGALAVILGALGAHWLESQLTPEQLTSFNTGVRYQAWHAIACLFLAGQAEKIKGAKLVAWFWALGSLFFSLSIYVLSTRTITGLSVSWLGPVTPFGGILLIAGWVTLLILALKNKS